MAWFEYLKNSGFFHPDNNPKPVKTENGTYMPHWDALDYLEKLAVSFSDGKESKLIAAVIEIIKDVSDHPIDNYHTWYRLVNILSRIPVNDIPITILDYMPIWVSTQYDSSIVTSALAETLFAHLLSNNPSPESIEKASKVFGNLLDIKKKWNIQNEHPADVRNYYSPYDLYNLTHGLLETDNFELIIKYFDIRQCILLLDKINILARDQICTAELSSEHERYILKAIPMETDLHISVYNETSPDRERIYQDVIPNYIDNGNGWEVGYFNKVFEDIGIVEVSKEFALKRISFTLYNDFESLLGLEPISDLQDNQSMGNPILNAFALIFRNWISELAIKDIDKAKSILDHLLNNSRYQLPYFKRLVIYASGRNWAQLRDTFWKAVGETNEEIPFSIDVYKVEIYEVLRDNQGNLDNNDIARLKYIIKNGPIGERHYMTSADAWALRWLDALQNNPEFAEDFQTMNEKFPRKHDFASDGRVNVRVGNLAPMTVEDMLGMDISEIVQTLQSFKSTGRWEDPTEEGLAEILRQAVENAPQRFVSEIESFNNIIYLYAYNLILGLEQALKKGNVFDWDSALTYCFKYITSSEFETNSLYSTADPRATQDWIYGEIGNLISEGSKGEKDGFYEKELLVAEKTVVWICSKLQPSKLNNSETANLDYVTYSLNSTQGKVARALLDCSLKDARIQAKTKKNVVWKSSLKDSYCNMLKSDIIDGYILEGMYLPQFMFLDEGWLKEQIISNQTLEFREWAAFMGGIAFGKPISGEYYPIMLPHYQRAVNLQHIDIHYNSGILRHLLAFYFWDYDASFKETLLYKALQNANQALVSQLITLINQQKSSMQSLTDSDYNRLFLKILELWKVLLEKLESVESVDRRDFHQLARFVDFIRPTDLDQEKTDLVINTMSLSKGTGIPFQLKQILKLSSSDNAPFIAQLMARINITNLYEKEVIIQLIEFLYENMESKTANEIVSKLTIKGVDFLKPIYLKYNQN